jgi:phosphoglycerol transferase
MVASLLTVSLGALDPEQAFRLHMRYYDFIFPLFLIVAAAGLSQAPHEMPTWRRCVVAAPIGMAIVYIGYTRFAPYRFSFVDSPELSGMMFKIAPFFILCAIALLSVVVWSIASRKGSAFFLFVFAPCSILGATYYNNMQLRPLGEASVYDKAGMFVRQYLSPDERSRLIVTGEEVSGLFRSLFFIDQRDASYEAVAKGADYDASRAANDKKWLLVFGSEPSELAGARALRMRGFTLFELPDDNDFHYAASLSEGIDFRRRGFPLFVDNVSGLSGREIWGRWSDANIAPTVRIAFAQALPRHFVLRLSGTAYGPNIGKSLAIMVGAKRYEAPMPGAAFDMRLPVDLDDDQTRAVEFRPPAPISPDGLDKSQGGRRIGVGFVHLAVELR